MAGGQERVLRRRIKSGAVDEEDHARDGAHRRDACRQGAAARRGRPALQPHDHAGHREPRGRRHRGRSTRCCVEATDIKRVGIIVITSDRGLAGAYNSAVIRAAERELMAHEIEGRDYVARAHRQEGRVLLPLPQLPHRRVVHRHQRHAEVRGRPRRRREGHRACSRAARSTSCSSSTPSSSASGSQRVAVRRFLPLESHGHGSRPRATATSPPTASAEFEPSAEAVLEALLPRYVEARLFGALLESRGLRARQPSAGHESRRPTTPTSCASSSPGR